MEQVDALLQGDRLALARILTQIENDIPEKRRILDELFQHAGNAHVIGVTGPTGSGKSTLVNQLAQVYRHPSDGLEPARVAILAVDPTSPFSGGAVLGDRVRMRDLSGDPGVFIRSVATRGAMGGLSHTAAEMVTAIDAAGFDVIFVETVGVGQSELEIARLAHTVLLIENPGFGDDIQAIKAGILEIASIIALNKADRPGVEQTELALRSMLEMDPSGLPAGHHGYEDSTGEVTRQKDQSSWKVPLVRTVAVTGEGILNLVQMLREHLAFLKSSGVWQTDQKKRLRHDLEMIIREVLFQTWVARMNPQEYDQALDHLLDRTISPYQLAEELIASDYAAKTPAIHLK
ncbi:methylmalonyl Co-A mutase-associated GTPase MeaB [Leptolinea sp. HRD-7]|nr:methylmalonyl Co-A mutase-associated GTPase MeaB [Leptolinea sp. HRD-7]